MPEVILLEDEPVLRQELGEFLEELGYAPSCVSSLQEFDRHFDADRHRLAVIDIGLPDGCGLDLIQRLRQEGQQVGIVVFSARQTSADRISGLGLGADHYLGKGCDLDELAAVLAALERRLGLQRLPPPAVQPTAPNWTLEVGPRRLIIPGAPAVPLSQQDLLVLRCLMSQPGENISRRQIIEALGFDYLDYDQRRLDTQMRRLRRRVEDVSGQTLPVKTLRNSGYCFYEPAKVQA
ncbi:DNA-binding response regulator [Achromobacter marplatensis]|jgi:DNA-binding response OmpR family regulator|nr:response regulator transcription factor [Achromobacter marplatensis]OWT59352.1 DNA-binding response regulator [Achromobacter marplatensis]RBP16277.1 DNA-binding response OmpR family regulator [Achromobacter marplatensis]CAB3687637.1 Transcriptional regulatory protein OmpR [Achromobacter marplatensis]